MNLRLTFVVFIVVLLPVHGVWADAERSATPANEAIASAHPLATDAGLEILAKGGNAFDAAVAVAAALGVVEPYSSGMGGGGFYLLHRPSDQMYVMVDGREKAPIAASRDMYLDKDGNPLGKLAREGALAAGIPGMPMALVHLSKKYGKLSLSECLQPAIRYARDGFEVDARFITGATYKQELLLSSMAGDVFLQNGQPPQPGFVVKQPDLAKTLEAFAKKGAAGFYQGKVAKRMLKEVKKAGGIWTQKDLDDYQVVERKPVFGTYKGARIISAPPPSSGGIVLVNALNILEPYDLELLDGATRKHLIVEAMRRSYRDRAEYLGDPDFVEIPMERLASKFYADGQRASMRMDRATSSDSLPGIQPEQEGMHTTHFSVLDKAGNRVAGTQTINLWFGSGFMVPGVGILLNDEMDDFSIKPGVPNAYGLLGAGANEIQPGKRMLSSMTPTFLENDQGVAILGTPGGSRIISMVILGVLERMNGSDAREIVAKPRFHHQYMPDVLQFEAGAISTEELQVLKAFGHDTKEVGRKYGNMNAVTWDYDTGEVVSGADPRGVGMAKIRVY